MVQEISELLPFEFARANRVLLRVNESDLVVSPDANHSAVTEILRLNNNIETIKSVDALSLIHI